MGQIAKRCIIGMVDNQAFNGTQQKNPFNFEYFNYNYLALYIDSTQIPAKPLTPDFKKEQHIRSYYTLFIEGTGTHFSDTGNENSYEDYQGGYCLAVFDLT